MKSNVRSTPHQYEVGTVRSTAVLYEVHRTTAVLYQYSSTWHPKYFAICFCPSRIRTTTTAVSAHISRQSSSSLRGKAKLLWWWVCLRPQIEQVLAHLVSNVLLLLTNKTPTDRRPRAAPITSKPNTTNPSPSNLSCDTTVSSALNNPANLHYS